MLIDILTWINQRIPTCIHGDQLEGSLWLFKWTNQSVAFVKMFLRKNPIFWRCKSLHVPNVHTLHWINAKFGMQRDKLHISDCGKFQDQRSTGFSAVVLQRWDKNRQNSLKMQYFGILTICLRIGRGSVPTTYNFSTFKLAYDTI